MTPPTSCQIRDGDSLVNLLDNETPDRFPVRKHPRLSYYDYSTPNYYFITICTHGRKCIFGKAGQPNHRGQIAERGILAISRHFSSVMVDQYVVMPNHVHAILILQGQDIAMTTVIGQYKSYVSREIHKTEPQLSVWQTSFHDHVIRSQQSYEKIWLYIQSNPQNRKNDCFFEE